MKKPILDMETREVIRENKDIRVMNSVYFFFLKLIRRVPKFKFEASKIYYIFAIVPTIELYTLPKGIWSDGNDGFAISIRWFFWAAGVRIYKG